MFNIKKFLQAIGLSLLISIIASVIMGFLQLESSSFFLLIQMLAFYGSMGFFAVVFNPETPFTASYIGALIIAVLNILFANFVLGVWMFVNPASINNILSFAVITALAITAITVLVKNRRERLANA